MTHLLLYNVELLQVVLHEFKLSRLRLRVGRARNELVLLPDLVELHLELDHLVCQLSKMAIELWHLTQLFIGRHAPSHIGSEDP